MRRADPAGRRGLDHLIAQIEAVTGTPLAEPIGRESTLLGDLGLDSLQLLEVIVGVEAAACGAGPDHLPGLVTLGDLDDYRRALSRTAR